MKKQVNTMPCRRCGNEVPMTAIFCCWCGSQLVKKEVEEKEEIAVPEPRKLASGKWRIELRRENWQGIYPSYAEAKAAAIAVRAGYLKAKKEKFITLGEIIDDFIKTNEKTLSPSTVVGYKSMRKARFQSVMDKDPRKIDWQEAVDDESEKVTGKTISNAWRLITPAISLYNEKNPKLDPIILPKVRFPKSAKADKEFLEYDQILQLIAACKGKTGEMAILLGLHGLRRSELLALKKEDVDLKKGIIKVRKSMLLTDKHEKIVVPYNKTESSSRDVPIMIDRLKELIKDADPDQYLVNYTMSGTYRHVNKICEEYGLPQIGVHGLRHSFASLAYHLNWSIMTTMQVGGWCSPDVPQKIYTHLSIKDANADVIKMKEFLKQEVKVEKTEYSVNNSRKESSKSGNLITFSA